MDHLHLLDGSDRRNHIPPDLSSRSEGFHSRRMHNSDPAESQCCFWLGEYQFHSSEEMLSIGLESSKSKQSHAWCPKLISHRSPLIL